MTLSNVVIERQIALMRAEIMFLFASVTVIGIHFYVSDTIHNFIEYYLPPQYIIDTMYIVFSFATVYEFVKCAYYMHRLSQVE